MDAIGEYEIYKSFEIFEFLIYQKPMNESDEQGKRFHQDIATIEKRYEDFWEQGMMSDFCWMQLREESTQYKWRNLTETYFRQKVIKCKNFKLSAFT